MTFCLHFIVMKRELQAEIEYNELWWIVKK